MSSRELIIEVEEEESAWEFFEYGMKFGYEERLFRLERDPLIQTLARGIPAEALSKGFKIVDIITREPIENTEDIIKIIMRNNDQIIDAVSYDRALTHGLLTFINPSESEANKDVFIKAYKPEDYSYGYDKVTGQYQDANVTQKIVVRSDKTSKVENVGEDDTKVFDNDMSIHVATLETDTIGMFKGYIDSIFDDGWGYYITSESATLFTKTAGPGFKVYQLKAKDLKDEEKRNEKFAEIRKYTGKGSVIIEEIPENPDEPTPQFKFFSGNPIDFEKIVNVFLGRVAMMTKIPMSRLRGLEPGQLAAGEINQASYFDVLEEIQFIYKFVYLKAIEIVAKAIGSSLNLNKFDIEFNVRKSLTDIEQANLLTVQISNFASLFLIREDAGIPLETIQKLTKIEYEEDETMMKEAKERKEKLANSLQESENDNNSDDDNDDNDQLSD